MDTIPRGRHVTLATKVDGTLATALIDTGATMNIVTEELARKKGLKQEKLRNTLNISGYGGIRSAQGRTDFFISLEAIPHTQYKIQAAFVKEQPFDFILGAQFLIEQEMDFQYSKGKVTMEGKTIADIPLGSTSVPDPDHKILEYSFNAYHADTLNVETKLSKLRDKNRRGG